MRALVLAACLFLQACSSLPEATSQVRLSQVYGSVEGGRGILIQGSMTGVACILSFLGELPSGVVFSMEQGGCTASTKEETVIMEMDEMDEAMDDYSGWIP